MRRVIRPHEMSHEQRMAFVDEAERQGCNIRFAPLEQVAILHGSRRRAILLYGEWVPGLKSVRQSRTLWPKRLPESWHENGVPRRTIARPIPHPERLIDALKIGA